ncbi:CPBP family glutamic-type intramembrane protease [Monaibacterium marinum]|uniref:CPBP family glutamic-type intramembrane protease n=1 Tax=Pontivivens marinum TaxID=1690039 RepID=UPI0015E10A62|nr:CPBP family glutamic-type intramembrane protease [Monaibacterium marinum]
MERKGDDFPFYRGRPVALTLFDWVIILAAVVAGVGLLFTTLALFPSGLAGFIPAIVYVAVPLGALILVAGSSWTALFRPLQWNDAVIILGFFLLNAAVTIGVGALAVNLFETSRNPAVAIIETSTDFERALFFLKAVIQLLGEEIFSVLPFLAMLAWLYHSVGIRRTKAVFLAALVASILFALIHLPTYQWHLPQALVALVPIRMVLLLPYIITKNIWVSTAVHVLNDWAIFGLPLVVAMAAH